MAAHPPFLAVALAALGLHEAAERELRRQNVEMTMLFVFGRRDCPEPELRAALVAYVEGAPLPPVLGQQLLRRLHLAEVPQPAS